MWLAVPTAGALGFALAVTDWGLALRVALCEGTLCSYVDGVLPGAKPDRTPRWVGLWWRRDGTESRGRPGMVGAASDRQDPVS